MPDPDALVITEAGAAAVNGDYPYTGLHNSRPYWTLHESNVNIWWGTSVYGRWLIGTHLNWYGDTNFYFGWPMWANWCYEVLEAPWGLGEHPDTAMPLPLLSVWAPPLGPSSTNLLIQGLGNPARVLDSTPDITWDYVAGDCPGDQAAYRILAAGDPKLLEPGQADLWDSGIIETNATVTTYAGHPLGDNEMVFYRVMVRDPDGIWSYP